MDYLWTREALYLSRIEGLGFFFFFKPLKQNHRHSTGGRKSAFWVDVDQQRDPEGSFWTTLLSNFHREMTSMKRHHRDKVSPCQAESCCGSAMKQLHEKTLPISLPHVWPQQQQQSLLINYAFISYFQILQLPNSTALQVAWITNLWGSPWSAIVQQKAVAWTASSYHTKQSPEKTHIEYPITGVMHNMHIVIWIMNINLWLTSS